MSNTTLKAALTQIAADIKAARLERGSLTALTTSQKTSLVAAINELKANAGGGGGGAGIADGATAPTSTWSSQKIQQMLDALKANILDGAPAAFDTLKEIAAYIEQDKTGAAAMATSINNRLRFDEAQTLTVPQKKQACLNLGLDDPATDYLALYNAAKA